MRCDLAVVKLNNDAAITLHLYECAIIEAPSYARFAVQQI
jgi:hypothetical protein